MQPRDIEPRAMGLSHMDDDLVQGQRGGVDDLCVGGRDGNNLPGTSDPA
jgi:hypothetical protein